MKTINLNFELTDSSGQFVGFAYEALAKALERSIIQEKNVVIKYFDWALQLQKEPHEIQVDDADLRKLIEYVEQCQVLTVVSKYHIGKYLEKING